MLYLSKISKVFVVFSFLCISCHEKEAQKSKTEVTVNFKSDSIADSIINESFKFRLNSEERRNFLDSAIVKNPNMAYLYQQRAMPLYKQDKDELGLPFLEKAAELNPVRWLDYMAFMKCIFSKNYRDAIVDFNKALKLNGESYVMDHSYYFYLGLCNLQLNEFEKAKDFFEKSIAQSVKEDGEEWVHFVDLLYLGIAHYELKNYQIAINNFDKALLLQPKFCEAKYYKAFCLAGLEEYEKAKINLTQAKEDFINDDILYEDNTVYERYPYQVRKSWFGL